MLYIFPSNLSFLVIYLLDVYLLANTLFQHFSSVDSFSKLMVFHITTFSRDFFGFSHIFQGTFFNFLNFFKGLFFASGNFFKGLSIFLPSFYKKRGCKSSRRRRLTAVLSQHCTYGSRIQRFQ